MRSPLSVRLQAEENNIREFIFDREALDQVVKLACETITASWVPIAKASYANSISEFKVVVLDFAVSPQQQDRPQIRIEEDTPSLATRFRGFVNPATDAVVMLRNHEAAGIYWVRGTCLPARACAILPHTTVLEDADMCFQVPGVILEAGPMSCVVIFPVYE
jgi:hypothetical protein